MAKDSLIQVRVEDEVKSGADMLFEELGIDTPTAIRIFLNKALEQGGIPFDVKKDPFHSRGNIEHLEKIYTEMKAGAGEQHDLIEVKDE